ncbi:hypothetical protein PQX77_007929 [Marasmius sp. AFHP31]|nr:hypothetical protein PQX77_007929 [Marasmius sp. AFHP31]
MVSFHLSTSIVVVALFFGSATAAPTSHLALDKRAACSTSGESPCICGGALGIRRKNLKCPAAAFAFVDKTSTTDGKVKKQSSNFGLQVQCDHMVELQFIADKINAVPGICTKFQSAAGKADFDAFFDTINTSPNLVFVESSVNLAKGILFSGKSFGTQTDQKAASGVSSYLGLIKNDAENAADTIKAKMDSIMGAGNGFSSTFSSDYTSLMTRLATKAATDGKKLKPAAIPQQGGITIVDETQATINRCKRSWWIEARDFVVRQVTGKKPAATGAACQLPAKTPAKTPAKAPAKTPAKAPAKTPAKAPAKTPAKAPAKAPAKKTPAKAKVAPKKAAAKKVAPKKTAAKKVAPKKTAKKVAPKKTAAKKTAVKKTTKKKGKRSD